MGHPFTFSELFGVYRLLFSEAEAHEMASASIEGETESGGSQARESGRVNDVSLAYIPRQSVTLTTDTLLLLSLVSDELEAKVQAYRSRMRGGRAETSEESAMWNERRQILKRLTLDAFPRPGVD
jgi:hypothetical protein